MSSRLHTHGPLFNEDGTVTFRLFAPYAHQSVTLQLERKVPIQPDDDPHNQSGWHVEHIPMHPIDTANTLAAKVEGWEDTLPHSLARQQGATEGWWWVTVPAQDGDVYSFSLDGGRYLPDPASQCQPEGVHEASQLWMGQHRDNFRATPLLSGTVYELHVGTFTVEGTLWSAADHLDSLVGLVTHVEIMPINSFDGDRNWGYDGVSWFATQKTYGGPDALIYFVQRAHELGLAVILDVVYNHLGPVGNYLPQFGPYLGNSSSPWGAHLNLDELQSNAVRQLILANVEFWVSRFGIDGLRLDAVHALIDESSPTILQDISQTMDALQVQFRKPLVLIAESDRNDPSTVMSRDAGGAGMTAQWGDELHHAIKLLTTNQKDGYFKDYDDSFATLLTAWSQGFVFDDKYSRSRQRNVGGKIPGAISLRRLIGCIQNHDQVGNRPIGDRLNSQISEAAMRWAIAALCVSPHTPMLFMGEEFAATTPFPFFCNYGGPDMHQAIRDGRAREFANFEGFTEAMLDPIEWATFNAAKLNWDEANTETGKIRRHLWETALSLRTIPAFATGMQPTINTQRLGEYQGLMIRTPSRTLKSANNFFVVVNACDTPAEVTYPSWIRRSNTDCFFSAQSIEFGGNESQHDINEWTQPASLLPPWTLQVWRF